MHRRMIPEQTERSAVHKTEPALRCTRKLNNSHAADCKGNGSRHQLQYFAAGTHARGLYQFGLKLKMSGSGAGAESAS